jgi:uncharacterized integral membrane protein
MLHWLKIIGSIAGIVLVLLFAAINTQVVVLNFFFWKTEASLALFLIFSFVMGWLIGFFVPKLRNRNRHD